MTKNQEESIGRRRDKSVLNIIITDKISFNITGSINTY